jgi:hypothetical protein
VLVLVLAGRPFRMCYGVMPASVQHVQYAEG